MVKTITPKANISWHMQDFSLINIDDKWYNFSDFTGENGTVIMFICNHCPYVQEIIDSVVKDSEKMQSAGIGVIAVMSNDFVAYPEDSFENMKKFAKQHKFTFPYFLDETQEVAKAYDAVCTPDFFGFNSKLELQYRGCFINKQTGKHDLLNAITEIIEKGSTKIIQLPSLGCSIKWKN